MLIKYAEQKIIVNKENKRSFGEIFTPFHLIEKMFNMFDSIPTSLFKNKDLKWLDTGAGIGNFSIFLYNKLYTELIDIIEDDDNRHNHIINNMLYMIEINKDNVIILKNIFGENSNIYHGDFLEFNNDIKFDIIYGNPPYNNNGLIKTPTNTTVKKTNDGKTIWMDFVKKALSILTPYGKLLYIIPSIWMKPDKNLNYYYILKYKIDKLHTLSNTETNKIFNGNAQTPTCYFLLSNENNNGFIKLYDKCINQYIDYKIILNTPLPVFGASIIFKLQSYVEKFGYLKVKKTNSPSVKSKFNNNLNIIDFPYVNIKTCTLDNITPNIIFNYSNIPQAYYNISKIILAHKMYGFPFIDYDGNYGISNRDNYVIIDYNISELEIIKSFLSTKTALYIFEATRYRMKYLEKYAFELIPDITKLTNFPTDINDNTIADFFEFNHFERNAIQKLHKKKYTFF